jgi:peptide/nickel transport system permease protein
VPLGLWAAAGPRALDSVVMRACDVAFAFPAVLVAVLLAAAFGPGVTNGVVAVGVYGVPVFARLTRNAARAHWGSGYVWAAEVAGRRPAEISVFHILPNIAGALVNQATIQASVAVLADAALSYVGLGAQPPAPSWGRMLKDAQTLLDVAPWLSLFPGLAVMATVSGFLALGDSLGAARRHRVESEV